MASPPREAFEFFSLIYLYCYALSSIKKFHKFFEFLVNKFSSPVNITKYLEKSHNSSRITREKKTSHYQGF
jgi:hypothetical protein